MFLPRPVSFRARLLCWNMVVFTLVLAGVAATVFLALRSAMHSLVDHELQARATRFAGAFADGHYGMGRGMGMGMGMGRRRWDDESLSPVESAELNRFLTYQRPRYFNLRGQGIGPSTELPAWDKATVARARAGQTVFSNVTFNGEQVRVLSVPLRRDGQLAGVLQVARETGDSARIEARLRGALLALFLPAMLLVALGSVLLTRQVLQPVRGITQAATEIEAGDLSRRLSVAGRDEMAHLAVTFNAMLSRLEVAFVQKQRALEQQKRFTSDVSHELRTPLARMKGVTSLALESERSAESYRAALEIADNAADSMTRLVSDLLLLSRSDAGQLRLERAPLCLMEVLRDALPELSRPGARVLLEIPPDLPDICADRLHLKRVFLNLLDNARRHTPPDGRITISAQAVGGYVSVQVTDSGEGIAPQHLPHLGERFYRVDEARSRDESDSGSGLGLAICRSIIEAHGGAITIESVLHSGTTITLRLPITAPAAS